MVTQRHRSRHRNRRPQGTVLLVHSDTVSGSTTFLDSSYAERTITDYGTPYHTTEKKHFGDTSIYFDGTGDYLELDSHTDWDFGADDFTIDFWINTTQSPSAASRVIERWQYSGTSTTWANSDWQVALYPTYIQGRVSNGSSGPGAYVDSTTAINDGNWHHIAFIRKDDTLYLYVDGIMEALTDASGYTMPGSSRPLQIGETQDTASQEFEGYLDEIHIAKGNALWTTNFTPPGGPYTSDEDTVLLTHLNISDQSNYQHPLTFNGNPTTTSGIFSGALHFDGAGDYISIPDSDDWAFGDGDFTIDFWINPTTLNSNDSIIGQYVDSSNYHMLWVEGSEITWAVGDTVRHIDIGVALFTLGEWSHIALVRSGSIFIFYINGVSVGTDTYSGAFDNLSSTFNVGFTGWGQGFEGYISDLRISKGIARWTTDFTPPTEQYTADANTSLLLNFTGDRSSSQHSYTHNGNPTTVSGKFGGAYHFDGSGDWISVPYHTDWDIGLGDFTIDFWLNQSTINAYEPYFSFGAQSADNCFLIKRASSAISYYLYVYNNTYNSGTFITDTVVPDNVWIHIAVVRESNDLSIYFDGEHRGTYPNYLVNLDPGDGLRIGGGTWLSEYLTGSLDEIRLSDTARWSPNFTPPTEPHTTDSGTVLLLHFDGDQSNSKHTITYHGDPTTVSGKFNECLYFDGTGDYISAPDSDDWTFGADDFTIDCWVNFSSLSGLYQMITAQWAANTATQLFYYDNAADTFKFVFGHGGASLDSFTATSTWVPTFGIWYHIAVVRKDNGLLFFVDGQQLGGVIDVTGQSITNSPLRLTIGVYDVNIDTPDANSYFHGYMSELRISKVARYGYFDVPTEPHTVTSGTVLLLPFEGDASSENNTILYFGTPTTSSGVFDGSYYFNGSSGLEIDALTSDIHLSPSADTSVTGAVDFTVEAWVFISSSSGYTYTLYQLGASGSGSGSTSANMQGLTFRIVAGNIINIFAGNLSIDTSLPTVWMALQAEGFIDEAWNHIALSSKNNMPMVFINGALVPLTVQNPTYHTLNTFEDARLYVPRHLNIMSAGKYNGATDTTCASSSTYDNGYIDELIITKGVAKYTAGFTPPTHPLTAVSGTVLLLNCLHDESSSAHTITTAGGTPQLVSVSGTVGSFYFDGSGDHLSIPDSADWDFGTGDFTVECWVNTSDSSSDGNSRRIIVFGTNSDNSIQLVINSSSPVGTIDNFVNSATIVRSSTAIDDGNWHHVALVRGDAVERLYIDGYIEQTQSSTTNYTATIDPLIGRMSGANGYWHGNIGQMHISKGIDRYKFTPQTEAFIKDKDTKFLFRTVGDVSDSQHPLTFSTNSPIVAGRFANHGAIQLDGTDDRVLIPHHSDFDIEWTDSFTFSCWCKFGSGSSSEFLISKYTSGNRGFSINHESGLVQLILRNTVTTNDFLARSAYGTLITDGNWHHIMVTYDGTGAAGTAIYVDGVYGGLNIIRDTLNATIKNTEQIEIGARQGGYTWPGEITEVHFSRGIIREEYNFTPPIAPDTADAYTKLLLRFEGDISDSQHEIDFNGGITQAGGGPLGSGYFHFDGSNDYLSFPDSSDWDFGTGDFTIEFWFKTSSYDLQSGNNRRLIAFGQNADTAIQLMLLHEAPYTGSIGYYTNSAWQNYTKKNVCDGEWHHFAIVRESGKVFMFLDGHSRSYTGDTRNYTSTITPYIGRMYGANGYFDGDLAEIRISKGIARYTGSFDPPISYTADSYTKFLMNCDNDESGLENTMVPWGVPQYQAATISGSQYGSIYFNGTSGLTIPSDTWSYVTSTSPCSMDCWIKIDNHNSHTYWGNAIVSKVNNSGGGEQLWWVSQTGILGLARNSWWGGGGVYATSTIPENTWTHVALSYDGYAVRIFVNGVLEGQTPDTTSMWRSGGSQPAYIGECYIPNYAANRAGMLGHISGFRISNECLWTSDFTPPTNPAVSDADTKLLLHFDGDLSDNKHEITFNGNPQGTASNPPFDGGGSIYFDGTGDYVSIPDSTDWVFGSGDFTIDFWINSNSDVQDSGICIIGNEALQVGVSITSKVIKIRQGANFIVTATDLCNSGTWYHVAAVRFGTNAYLYINGVLQGSASFTNDISSDVLLIGAWTNTPTYLFNGNISEVRISKGIARWTTDFTPPTEPYTEVDTNTKLLLHFDGEESSNKHEVTFAGTDMRSIVSRDTITRYTTNDYSTTAYMTVPVHSDFNFGSSPFTIEFYLLPISFSQYMHAITYCPSSYVGWYTGIMISTGAPYFSTNTNSTVFYGTIPTNLHEWNHIAFVYDGVNLSMFTNGQADTSTALGSVQSNTSAPLYIGRSPETTQGGYPVAGHYASIRISNTARYTAAFTPQTEKFVSDANTKLLINFEEDGWGRYLSPATFTDSGNTAHTVTNVSSNLVGVTWPEEYLYIPGAANNYLAVPDHTDLDFSSGTFTIDFWVYWFGAPGDWDCFLAKTAGAPWTGWYFATYPSTNQLRFVTNTNVNVVVSDGTVPVNEWAHIAVTYDGSYIRLFINGILDGMEALGSVQTSAVTTYVGVLPTYGAYFKGYMSELRLSKDVVRWTTDFIPPTSAHTSDANTKLLLSCDNHDYSDNQHDITYNGNITNISGSMYFDGTGDYITVDNASLMAFGTDDFTIEMWVQITNKNNTQMFLNSRENGGDLDGIQIYYDDITDDGLYVSIDWGASFTHLLEGSQTSWVVDTWHHIAFVREDSNFYLFKDGLLLDSNSSSNSVTQGSSNVKIGCNQAVAYPLVGAIRSINIIKGEAKYTPNFTPPAEQYVKDDYTKLLIHFDGNDKSDSAHVLTFNGNPQGIASNPPFDGGGSMYFDGTGDYIGATDSELSLGTADFTIEVWVNINSLASTVQILSSRLASSTANNYWLLNATTNGEIFFQSRNTGGTQYYAKTGTGVITTGQWYHVCATREAGQLRVYVNGVMGTAQADNDGLNNLTEQTLSIGLFNFPGFVGYFNGYMSEVRISKDIVRWKAGFDINKDTKVLFPFDN